MSTAAVEMVTKSGRISKFCWILVLQLILVQHCSIQQQYNSCQASSLSTHSNGSSDDQYEEFFDTSDSDLAQEDFENVGSGDETHLGQSDNEDQDEEFHDAVVDLISLPDLIQGSESQQLQRTNSKKNLADRIRDAASSAIAPAKLYFDVAKRFTIWRRDYLAFRNKFGYNNESGEPILKDAIEVLQIEYANVDQELHKKACSGDAESQSNTENFDFILRVLRLLIDRLEEHLDMLKRVGVQATLNAHSNDASAEIEQNIQNATDRAKRIVTKSAVNLVRGELEVLIKTFAFNAIATYVVNNNQALDPGMMSHIEPIVLLLGTANTPLIVSYLQNIRFRTTMKLFNYSLSLFTCKRETDGTIKQTNIRQTLLASPMGKIFKQNRD